ncbi:MAG: cytochrome c oxidase subunit II [Chitinophagaceae bacterium]|nr:MAG: cytochrome c oxidase subunit II [Chitinophagaceae bacterium]
MSTTAVFILSILGLGFLITFQIAKASEYVSVLKGEKKAFEQSNKVNAFLMVAFLVLGLIGVWWCNKILYHKTLLVQPSASDHGEHIDTLMFVTIAITGIVFVITQVLLFWFAYKYQYNEKRTAFFYPHNNKLEILWTTVPAITLVIMVGFGLFYWFQITGDPPANHMTVEITGKQFNWIYRYPGKDNVFGKKYFKNISDVDGNELGLIWEDPATHDDLIVSGSPMFLVKDKPVQLVIGSRDVIHDVGLPHFRLKMDAVPGTPTTLWFTPKYTTEEMRKITKNENFDYEIACDQMCGNGHYSMRGVIKVVTAEEYALWRAALKPKYTELFPAEGGATPAAAPAKDSATKQAAVTAPAKAIVKN